MVAVSEKILGWKIGMKNFKTGNQCEKLKLVKILGWKIGVKNSSQKMKKIGLSKNISGGKIRRKLESEKKF